MTCSRNAPVTNLQFIRDLVDSLSGDYITTIAYLLHSRPDVWMGGLAPVFRVRDILSSNPGSEIAFSFRQSLQTNVGIVPEIGTASFHILSSP